MAKKTTYVEKNQKKKINNKTIIIICVSIIISFTLLGFGLGYLISYLVHLGI